MPRLPKIQLHRNGLLAVAGIVLLALLFGAVRTVAVLRAVTALVVIVGFVEILLYFVRRGELRIPSRLFNSQSTLNPTRKSTKQ